MILSDCIGDTNSINKKLLNSGNLNGDDAFFSGCFEKNERMICIALPTIRSAFVQGDEHSDRLRANGISNVAKHP